MQGAGQSHGGGTESSDSMLLCVLFHGPAFTIHERKQVGKGDISAEGDLVGYF